MNQKEERDLNNAINFDGGQIDIDESIEIMNIDKEESERFFREASRALVNGTDMVLLDHRRKRVNGNLAKHWFIYEYPDRKEVRLLSSNQNINGENYSFMDVVDKSVFSYS
jgi:hypothetical protein